MCSHQEMLHVGMQKFQFESIPILELVGIGWNWNWNWLELVGIGWNWLELVWNSYRIGSKSIQNWLKLIVQLIILD